MESATVTKPPASQADTPAGGKSDRGIQLVLAWSGPAATLLAALGLVIVGGFIPVKSPSDSAQQIADFYSSNATQLRIGMLLAMIGFTLFVPFGIAIALQTRRSENKPVMTYIQIACVAIAALEGVMAAFIWAAATFRAGDIDPEFTRTLNDVGWFAFLFDVPPFTLWIGAIAIAIFRDGGRPPVFPRWVGYFNLWVAFLILPAEMMAFFKHGPFGFNGLLALYLPAGLFFAWILVMTPVVIKAINQESSSQAAPA